MDDETNFAAERTAYYRDYFSTKVGDVVDPFFDTINIYEMWKHPTKTSSFIWLKKTTNAIVFLQDKWEEIRKTIALYFPDGGLKERPNISKSNFLVNKCDSALFKK